MMPTLKFIFEYCFTKKIVLILIGLSALLISLFMLSLIGINETLSYEEVIINYSINSINYTKIVISLLSCYLFTNVYNNKCLFAINFIVSSGKKKEKYLNNFIVINLVILLLFVFITFIFYLIIGKILKNYFAISLNYINCFTSVLLLAFYYGFLSLLFMQIFKSQIGFLFSFVLFILSELITSDNNILSIFIKFFLPNFLELSGLTISEYLSIIVLLLFIYFICKSHFNKVDLNY